MRRVVILLALVAACARSPGSSSSTLTNSEALQAAEEVREGCVASTLELMQRVVNLLAPVSNARSLEQLDAFATERGCSLVPGTTEHTLYCGAMDIRGEPVVVNVRLTYLADGLPVQDPGDSDTLVVDIEANGLVLQTAGQLSLTWDFERGLLVDGSLATIYGDCGLDGTLDNVAVRLIADLPGVAVGALFTSGNVDLGVDTPDGYVSGTAALSGRIALVALQVAGFFTHAAVDLAD